jgi:pyrroline-5-carboxylate reductase
MKLSSRAPVLLLGAGRMGGAMITGWRRTGALTYSDILLVDPHPSPEAKRADEGGARLNPPLPALATAKTVVLAVKPQMWRAAAAEYAPHLAKDAAVVSIAAGVTCADLSEAFAGRTIARVMPTTGVAIAKGVASIYAPSEAGRAAAHALFDCIAATVDVDEEALIDAATGVSGSAPAYLYALVETLAAAGEKVGLAPEAAQVLARKTLESAAALMAESEDSPAELRRQVTSPAGTTEAALKVLLAEDGLPKLMTEAVAAAVARARELG